MKNLAKEQRDLAWRYSRRRVSYSAQSSFLRELRNDPDLAPWLSEAPAQVLQQALLDLDRAYSRFLKGEAGHPNWATKTGWVAFRDPQNVVIMRLSLRWGEVKIQGIGPVRVRMHRPPVGSRVCSATYIEEPDGKVFISVVFEVRKCRPARPLVADLTTAVGVDRGVAVAVATSEGDKDDRDMWTTGERRRLKKLEQERERQKRSRLAANRKLAKDHKPRKSKNQEATERAIAALHARARRRRRDFVEQESYRLAKNHRLIVFEDLHVAAMTRSARGTKDRPSSNVAQKAGLNRAVLDKGWAELQTRTEQKSIRHGHRSLKVPAPGTSITCPDPDCGVVDPASRVSRSMFVCTHCGYRGHADVTAAINILERGIKLALAGGTPVTAHPGTNRGPAGPRDPTGAEPLALAGRGSGNEKTGCITGREVA